MSDRPLSPFRGGYHLALARLAGGSMTAAQYPLHEPGSPVIDLAAALCVGLAKNRPFNDGNKRTALLTTRACLHLNGQALEPAQHDEVATMLAVADGMIDEPYLADWLRANSHIRESSK